MSPDAVIFLIAALSPQSVFIACTFFDTALEVTCVTGAVPGEQIFFCDSSNPLNESLTVCSFDGGAPEMCSLPLEVGIGRFGTDNHTVAVSVVDIFGQRLDLFFVFRLVEREFDV